MNVSTSLPKQINDAHRLAQQHAETAIEHARRAGELLTQAKQTIPHGSCLEWLEAHCEVSERQAQRYMRLAANPTRVSFSMRAAPADLSKPREKRPLVESGSVALGFLGDSLTFVIEESRRHPGYWHAINMLDGSYNGRPIRADGLPHAIGPLLSICRWRLSPSNGEPIISEQHA